MRFLVANLLYKRVAVSADLARLVPDIHEGINAGHLVGDRTTFIKTHWKYHERLPLREDTTAAIYVVRHPLQVIASNLNYLVLRAGSRYLDAPEEKKRQVEARFVAEFVARGGAVEWVRHGMGTWPENVQSWLSESVRFPRLSVRYEDIKRDPAEFVAQLCRFLKLDKSKEEIDAAVAASSFDALRDMEEREIATNTSGFFTSGDVAAAHAAGRRFLDRGRIDSYREVLSPSQIESATSQFKPLMDELGYEP